jgi:hypothetical protein
MRRSGSSCPPSMPRQSPCCSSERAHRCFLYIGRYEKDKKNRLRIHGSVNLDLWQIGIAVDVVVLCVTYASRREHGYHDDARDHAFRDGKSIRAVWVAQHAARVVKSRQRVAQLQGHQAVPETKVIIIDCQDRQVAVMGRKQQSRGMLDGVAMLAYSNAGLAKTYTHISLVPETCSHERS